MVVLETVGHYLRRKREARGLVYTMLSAKTAETGKPLHSNSIRDIEQGKRVPKPETLRRLAIALTGKNALTHEYVEVDYEELLRLAGYLAAAPPLAPSLGSPRQPDDALPDGLVVPTSIDEALEIWGYVQRIPPAARPAVKRILRETAEIYEVGKKTAEEEAKEQPK